MKYEIIFDALEQNVDILIMLYMVFPVVLTIIGVICMGIYAIIKEIKDRS